MVLVVQALLITLQEVQKVLTLYFLQLHPQVAVVAAVVEQASNQVKQAVQAVVHALTPTHLVVLATKVAILQ